MGKQNLGIPPILDALPEAGNTPIVAIPVPFF
jgi:hypothetical protein